MSDSTIPRPGARRGCGCGCLVTTPLALLLTGVAAWLWVPQALRFAVFIVGGQEADPWPLAGATALILAAQLIPRGLPLLRRGLRLLWRRLGAVFAHRLPSGPLGPVARLRPDWVERLRQAWVADWDN